MSTFAANLHANMLAVALIGIGFPLDIDDVSLGAFAHMVRAAKFHAALFYYPRFSIFKLHSKNPPLLIHPSDVTS